MLMKALPIQKQTHESKKSANYLHGNSKKAYFVATKHRTTSLSTIKKPFAYRKDVTPRDNFSKTE